MPDPTIEYRTSLDVRAEADPAGFTGYASTFWAVDSYGTAMAPGAFRKSIKERAAKLPVLWQHNPDWPVGKHLELKEDKHGLFVNVGIVNDGAEGSVLLERLRFGVPLGMSFGFRKMKSRAASDDDPLDFAQMPGLKHGDVEVYTETAYWESSAVTFPANTQAAITNVRSTMALDVLTSLLESTQRGEMPDEAIRSLLVQSAAAITNAAEPEPEAAPLTDIVAARRTRDIEVALALHQWRHVLRRSA